MKRIALLVALVIMMQATRHIYAECSEPTFRKMRSTAYILTGITSTGCEVREGICATGDPELIGKTLMLYQRLPDGSRGEFLGYFEVLDSGCHENVIDVWQPDIERAQAWMDRVYADGCQGKIYVQIIDAEG